MKHNIPNYFNQQTPRLTFRRVTKDDIESWHQFFVGNSSLHFLGLDLSKTSEELATNWIHKQLERYEKEGLGHLTVIDKETNTLIGMGGILPRDIEGILYYEIAYSLKPYYWKKGYGTEIATQMRLFGTEYKISNQFISIIDKQNLDSIHVAQKNKMKILSETNYLGMEVYIFGTEINSK